MTPFLGGSGGPGPGTLIDAGRIGRATGTSTCRERALSAGLSVKALPAAPRMKVCHKVSLDQKSTE
jgi:hypothetical protein